MKKNLCKCLVLIIAMLAFIPNNANAIDGEKKVNTIESIIGKDRFETAIKLSESFKDADSAILVNYSGIADALAATPYAAKKNLPILLTYSNVLNEATKNQIIKQGYKSITIIGGTGAVSEDVSNELKNMGIDVRRIAGENRFETAEEIAKQMGSIDKVAIVNGVIGLPDALSIAAPAARDNMAIILSDGKNISNGKEIIKNATERYIVGGNCVIDDSLVEILGAKRLSGADRNATNAVVLDEFYKDENIEKMYIAKDGTKSLNQLVDALAVGPLAGINGNPVLLVGANLESNQINYIKGKNINILSQVGGGINVNIINKIKSGKFEDKNINIGSKKGVFNDLGFTDQPFQVNTGVMYHNNKGEDVLYAGTIVMGGTQCTFFSFNTVTEKIEKMITIPNASGIVSIETDGDCVYFGTYNSATLYKYNIITEQVQKLADIKNDNYIWDIKPYSGRVYLGTSPRSRVYKFYENENYLEDLGSFSNNQYARSVEYYEGNVYSGTGSPAELIEYNDITKTKKNILPNKYSGQFVKYLRVEDSKLFIILYPTNTVLTYDFKTKTFTERMETISNKYYDYYPTFDDNYITFRSADGYIFHYNKTTDTLKLLQYNGNGMTSAGVINDSYICGINQDGCYFKNELNGHNPQKLDLRTQGLKGFSGIPVYMYPYNNKIYFGGKKMGIYDVVEKQTVFKNVSGEVKSITALNDEIFTGNYADATIWKFNKNDVDDKVQNDLNNNNSLLYTIPKEQNQNRPDCMISSEKTGTVIVASEPVPGTYGGSLTIYNSNTGAISTRKDIIKNQYIHSMTYDQTNPDIVYLGGSSQYTYGTNSLNDSAILTKYNIKTNTKIFSAVPENVSNRIASVAQSNNIIYCITNKGTLVSVDSNTGKILKSKNNFWYREIIASKDGSIYAINNMGFWKINPNTLESNLLKGDLKNPTNLKEDIITGKIYFYNDRNLISYE